ncbi:citrate lyase acyl carrier protein [Proteiniclasticum sp. QWL-01]|uniref:citrate lyase acyl carrier protein n=1 Tax=Proteiniclasticum sp. QWL-01 TaxID=3036945 RepID=UPI0021FB30AD|nr:citrate lyase acyl carrier protein [Proteiniclasticum sp. QWL-01]UUM11843.1 citrate lyase acyl carrier protein [Clostridiaceae bacterium HFYG-1003]WFF73335.1 citrate lyase acyl carrier protein [Proteiniclasticum sp. QWL-01]
MTLNKPAKAGSLESNDILIQVYPAADRTIELESPVKQQFGDAILAVINEVLDEMQVEAVRVIAKDRGALDFAIRARVRTALERGA